MAALHLDAVPESVRDAIVRLAATRGTSVEEEALRILERGLASEPTSQSQAAVLAEVKRRSFVPPAGTPDSVELLREDRAR